MVAGLIFALLATGAVAAPAPSPAAAVTPPGRAKTPDSKLPGGIPDNLLLRAFVCVDHVLAFQTAAAQEECGKLIAALPDDPLGYKYRGIAYLLDHRFERAEDDFRAAVRLDPKDPENQAGYAQALTGEGRYAAAISRLDTALKLAPRDARFWNARCWARAAQGTRLAAAMADCERAGALAPAYGATFDSVGLVWLRQHQNAKAVAAYSRSLALAPGRPTAYFGRGLAELNLGQNQAGRQDVREARKRDAEIDDLFLMMGVLSPGCRELAAPCELPDDLRQRPAPAGVPFIAVSFEQSFSREGTLRALTLSHLDSMVRQTALLLHAELPPAAVWQDADPAAAQRHLDWLRAAFARLQSPACQKHMLACGVTAPAREATLHQAIEPLWAGLCRPGGNCRLD
jgi:tetratricopeptide (TPR) repeat protein